MLTIYRWYRTLSPHIDIKVDSAGTSEMHGVWSPVLMYSCSIRPTQRASLRITSADLCIVVYSSLQSAGSTCFSVATHTDYLPITRRNQGWLYKKRYYSGTCKPSLQQTKVLHRQSGRLVSGCRSYAVLRTRARAFSLVRVATV